MDPVIGRDDEILTRGAGVIPQDKNNPVLDRRTGEWENRHRGRTGARIVNGDAPEGLKNKRVMRPGYGRIDCRHEVSRGNSKTVLKAVLKEVTKKGGQIILFIDELHTVVGAGAAEGAVDASNLLKPALARRTALRRGDDPG